MSKPFKSSFKYRVQRRMEKEGWTVFPICDSESSIDLLCFRTGSVVGIRVQAHGHIYDKERDVLSRLGAKLHIGVFYVHEAPGRELAFTILRKY